MVKIGDVCKLVSGNSIPETIVSNIGELPYVKVAELNLRENTPCITTSRNFVNEKDISVKQIIPAGTVIFPKRGGAIGTNKKRLVSVPICMDLNLMGVIPSEKILPQYLYFFFENIDMGALSNGSSVPQINNSDIAPLEIKLPDLVTQENIVYRLDKVSELISLRKEQLAKLDQLVKSRFIELFDNEEYEKVTVSSVLNTGFWLMPATPEFIVDGKVPYITSKNIKSRTIDFDNVKYISREAYQSISANRPTQKGDILISMIGTLGQTAVIQDDREFYGQNLYLLRLNSSIIDTTYFCEFFNSDAVQHELQGKRNQSTQAYLKANHVEDLALPLPPMGLQQQFAAFVEHTDKSKLSIQKSLDKLETLKKSLMQEYFGRKEDCMYG